MEMIERYPPMIGGVAEPKVPRLPPLGPGRWIEIREAARLRANDILKAEKQALARTGPMSGEAGKPFRNAANKLKDLLKQEGAGWTQEYREEIMKKIDEYTRKAGTESHPFNR